MRNPRELHCLIALVSIAFVSGCVSRSENEVVLYVSADREFAAPILDSFERANKPIEIARQYDVESTKTVGLVTRILEEEKKPRCDVFWNSEILHTIRLQKAGILRSRRWKIPSGWPEELKAKDGTWVGIAGRARVLLVNHERLPNQAEWPTSVLELSQEKWKGKCGLAFPLFGTTTTHFVAIANRLGDVKAEEWFTQVASNAVTLSGNKQVAQAVSSGELLWGLTDTDDALVEKENGMKVAMVFPDQKPDEMGTLRIPNTISVINQGPHPIAAGKLADFLVSEKTEERLTMGNAAQFPVWPNASEKPAQRALESNVDSTKTNDQRNALPSVDSPTSQTNEGSKPGQSVRWMKVDYESIASTWELWAPKLKTIFTSTSR